MAFGKLLGGLALVILYVAPYLSNAQLPKSWKQNKHYRCDNCSFARWRGCNAPDPGKVLGKPYVNTCVCRPDFVAQKVTLHCDNELSAKWGRGEFDPKKIAPALADKCCNFNACKDSDPFNRWKENDTAVPCIMENDLILLLDSSGSVGEDNFQIAKKFVLEMTKAWIERGNRKSRVAFLDFAASVSTAFTFQQSLTMLPESLYSIINNWGYGKGGTHTSSGVKLARATFNASPRSGVRRNLLTITDGDYTAGYNPYEEIAELQKMGIRVFAVGIGDIKQSNLEELAGGEKTRVAYIQDFNTLVRILNPVSTSICYGDYKKPPNTG